MGLPSARLQVIVGTGLVGRGTAVSERKGTRARPRETGNFLCLLPGTLSVEPPTLSNPVGGWFGETT